MYKLVYTVSGNDVLVGDIVLYACNTASVNEVFPDDGTVLLASRYGIAMVKASDICAERVHIAGSSDMEKIIDEVENIQTTCAPSQPSHNFERLNEATKRIDQRTEKWDKTVSDLDSQINWATGKGNAELAEALKFAKLYAEGQAATMLDVIGMF